jgi:hypothetical protein
MQGMKLTKDRSKDYFIQRNNEVEPNDSCQVTAMVNGLYLVNPEYLNAIDRVGTFGQPEDDLRYYCGHEPAILAYCKNSHGETKIHPAEWADCLIYAVNRIIGKQVVFFSPSISYPSIQTQLSLYDRPVMVSLKFPNKGIAGHYVLVVGMDMNGLIVNDPWGKSMLDDSDGYECRYTYMQLEKHSKGYGMVFINDKRL